MISVARANMQTPLFVEMKRREEGRPTPSEDAVLREEYNEYRRAWQAAIGRPIGEKRRGRPS